jgi:NAD(P)-dependent dehydrogenase (short-subunit alcohol dehydrogenase family)
MPKTWFVTGAGRGLGRAIAGAALDRGDSVAATSRRLEDVADLAERYGERVLPLTLDIRDRAAASAGGAAAHERFGRLDVVVNNAARSLIGAVEEVTEAEARDLIDTNLLGTLWVTQAALPILRAQGGGHIVQISSGGGVISWPMNGVYQASKWGLEGMSEALAQESGHLGVKVTIVQVGHMESGFGRPRALDQPALEAYEGPRALLSGVGGRKGNDPSDLAIDLLKVVDAVEPPLRVLLGRPLADIRAAYEQRLATWEEWLRKMYGGI